MSTTLKINGTSVVYPPPLWLRSGHLQTIWSARVANRFYSHQMSFRRERWVTPDQDFLDIDWLAETSKKTDQESPPTLMTGNTSTQPLLVLFHGLEGGQDSHYVKTFAFYAQKLGYQFALPYFRSCSGEMNLSKRMYYSGDWQEIDWLLRKFKSLHQGPILAVGISLGGNSLLHWAGKIGEHATQLVTSIASVCAPLDMVACGLNLGKGIDRLLYTRNFLSTLIPKALKKWDQYPGLFDRNKLMAAQDLFTFDEIFTGPIHGFSGAMDYWQKTSAKPHLNNIQVPTLLVNTQNDPFIPKTCLPQSNDYNPYVTLWQPKEGGHVGFFCKPASTRGIYYIPEQIGQWLSQFVPQSIGNL